jgi:hypothetical protein
MIVVDINTFAPLFESQSTDHQEFSQVLSWVKSTKVACFVYGGTKYKTELKKAHKYLHLFDELKKAGKIAQIDDALVDTYEKKLEGMCSDSAFNDKHLVAIIEVSNCRLICTKDEEAMPYIKNRAFYESSSPPKIYSGSRNKDLLNHTNIISLKNIV